MLKTFSKSLAILALVASVAACSDSSTPTEGKQYRTLDTNLSTYRLPQVTEVFSLAVATAVTSSQCCLN
ncbi:hypothetical protein JCM19239_2429 [Vibrio variabilis]|uniref:Uncharacterized protein n=1 Tax=Vibrio variabilis TaxID=990271 RepID=A0ABQ0JK08_9VIBR|nr:hypothetical protein JCM19239_2429 [Vibrio variabilis]